MKTARQLFSSILLTLPACAFSWSTPQLLHEGTSTTVDFDRRVAVAAGAHGRLGALWTSNAPRLLDFGIPFRSSGDGGASWTTPHDVSARAGIPYDVADGPALASAGSTWVAAWSACPFSGNLIDEGRDIWISRSLDGGNSWSAPQQLNSDFADNRYRHHAPSLATDGNGQWTAVWLRSVNDGLNSPLTAAIMTASSADNGASWSAAQVLATCTDTQEGGPRIAVSSGGDWVVVWSSDAPVSTTGLIPKSIYCSRRAQGSGAWSPAARLTLEDSNTAGGSHTPCLAAGPGNQWVAVWVSNAVIKPFSSWPDADLYASVSSDGGSTWTLPAPLNSDFAADQREDIEPTVAWDGQQYQVVWSTRASEGGLATASSANGLTWSAVSHPFSSSAANGSPGSAPVLIRSGANSLLLAWNRPADTERESDLYFATLGSSSAADWQLFQ